MCDKVFAALSYEYPKISANIKKEKMQDAQGILKSMTGLSGQTPTGLSGPRGIFAKDLSAAKWHAYGIVAGEFDGCRIIRRTGLSGPPTTGLSGRIKKTAKEEKGVQVGCVQMVDRRVPRIAGLSGRPDYPVHQ